MVVVAALAALCVAAVVLCVATGRIHRASEALARVDPGRTEVIAAALGVETDRLARSVTDRTHR